MRRESIERTEKVNASLDDENWYVNGGEESNIFDDKSSHVTVISQLA